MEAEATDRSDMRKQKRQMEAEATIGSKGSIGKRQSEARVGSDGRMRKPEVEIIVKSEKNLT